MPRDSRNAESSAASRPRKGNDRRQGQGRPRSAGPPRREKKPDPDSPFAKLAQLKQELTPAKD